MPIFQAIASKYFHLGPSGAGTTMKMVVNAILGIEMQAIAEAISLGERAGLSRDVLPEVLSQTAVIAPAHVGKLSRAIRGDFHLILQLAADVRAVMPATSAAFQVNSDAIVTHSHQDFSVVMQCVEEINAKKLSSKSIAS